MNGPPESGFSAEEQDWRDQEFTEAVHALLPLRNPDGSDAMEEALRVARGLELDACPTCGAMTMHERGSCVECHA